MRNEELKRLAALVEELEKELHVAEERILDLERREADVENELHDLKKTID